MAQYEQVLQAQPRYPQAHNNIAVCLAQMGRIPEAIEQFKAELQIWPDDADTLENLAKTEKLQEGTPGKR
jgi:tetratricopeptide (TPR) repeat protein